MEYHPYYVLYSPEFQGEYIRDVGYNYHETDDFYNISSNFIDAMRFASFNDALYASMYIHRHDDRRFDIIQIESIGKKVSVKDIENIFTD